MKYLKVFKIFEENYENNEITFSEWIRLANQSVEMSQREVNALTNNGKWKASFKYRLELKPNKKFSPIKFLKGDDNQYIESININIKGHTSINIRKIPDEYYIINVSCEYKSRSNSKSYKCDELEGALIQLNNIGVYQ